VSDSAHSLLDRTEQNAKRSSLLVLPQAVAGALIVGIVLALLVTWWVGLIAAVVVGVAIAVILPRSVMAGLQTVFTSRPAPEPEYPRYHNLMEGLAISSGTATPELRVIDEAGLNLAVYGKPEAAVVIATTGLLEHLDRVELEGVLAAALGRIRSNDADLGAQAALLVCGAQVRNGPRRDGRPIAMVTLLAAVRSKRLKSQMGEHREFLSDLAAIDLTRYPPGLGSALERMESLGTGVATATWGTAHLWLADPLLAPLDGNETAWRLNQLFGGATPIDQRASLMAEL